jgi:6-phosphogluconolactonase
MSIQILQVANGSDSALEQAGKAAFDVMTEVPHDQPIVVGVCGGRSVVGFLRALQTQLSTRDQELVRRVHFFMVDERIVPLSSEESNYGALKKMLFDSLISDGVISQEQLHPFEATTANAQQRCIDYMSELRLYGGRFSLVVLGVGEDGHVAGLFPQHPTLAVQGHGFECFSDSPKPPPARMTATRDLVLASRFGVLLVMGEAKREAWKAWNDASVVEQRCPAKMVKALPRGVVVTDIS